MNRRRLIQFAIGASLLSAPHAMARGPGSGGSDREPPVFDMTMIGLPVIRGGRLVNYVFVNLRLHLRPGTRPETLQPKEPLLRDAIVRAGHATPFVGPVRNDELNLTTLNAAVMRHAAQLLGQGIVTRVEVLKQMSRNR